MQLSRVVLAGLLILSLFAFAPNSSRAQPKGPARPPAISSFISMGSNQPINYFTITRPTLEFRSLQNRQAAELGSIERTLTKQTSPGLTPGGEFEHTLPTTGHKVYFNNTSRYYPRR